MGAPGLTSPIRSEAFEHLELNAGVFIPNFDLSGINDIASLKTAVQERIEYNTTLGVTSGGGTFTATRETRVPEVDGRRYGFVGAQFIDSMDGYITSTLVEITSKNWRRIIGSAVDGDSDAEEEAIDVSDYPETLPTSELPDMIIGRYALDIKTMLSDKSYLTNLVWVGDLAGGGYVAIEFDNALNTADLSFTFQDKSEGKLPFEFHAHQGAVRDYDKAPFRIHYFLGDIVKYTKETVSTTGTGVGYVYNSSSAYGWPYLSAGDYILTGTISTTPPYDDKQSLEIIAYLSQTGVRTVYHEKISGTTTPADFSARFTLAKDTGNLQLSNWNANSDTPTTFSNLKLYKLT